MTKLGNSNKKSERLNKSLMIIKRHPQNWRLKWLIWMTSGANLRESSKATGTSSTAEMSTLRTKLKETERNVESKEG